MANIAPERRLDWMIDELNGRLHSDGLSIPLHGAEMDAINLTKGQIEGHSILKLKVGNFERNLPLPASVETVSAVMKDGVLDVRW